VTHTTNEDRKMSKATFVESYSSPSFSCLSSKDASSSSSLFALPQASVNGSSKQTDSTPSEQTHSCQSSDSLTVPGQQQPNILANKKRKFESVVEEEIVSQTADRYAVDQSFLFTYARLTSRLYQSCLLSSLRPFFCIISRH
jgi:hypothetical protein